VVCARQLFENWIQATKPVLIDLGGPKLRPAHPPDGLVQNLAQPTTTVAALQQLLEVLIKSTDG